MGKLDVIIKEINKQYKEDIAARGIARVNTQRIPLSSPRVNYMLYGGLPRGRLVEFAGEESGGKTTTALDATANAQKLFTEEWLKEKADIEAIEKRNKTQQARLDYLTARGAQKVVYCDCENTLDEEWAQLLGVDVDELVVIKPMSQTAEQIFEMLLQMIETDEVGLVVIDSIGVMLSAQAYEKTMEEKTYGGIAAALTLFSKKAELLCTKYNCTLIGINQMREDMNSPYGGLTTTGGKGWKHNCSLRLLFQKGDYIDVANNKMKRSAEDPAGNLVMMNITKTKICKPDRRVGYYTLKYDTGIDVVADIVDTALKNNLIIQMGSWFNFVDLSTGAVLKNEEGEDIQVQGRSSLIEYLKTNHALRDTLWNKLQETNKREY